jgi:5-methylcytosine-specific restriction endonuclease McrA
MLGIVRRKSIVSPSPETILKRRAAVKRWADRNRDHLARTAKERRLKDPEATKIKDRNHHARHKSKRSENNRLWRVANSTHRQSYMAKWWADNQGKKKAYDTRRRFVRRLRDKEAKSKDPFVDSIIERWKSEPWFVCYYCGNEFERGALHIDHITPVSRGGKHTADNICRSCSTCNQSKRDKPVSQFVVNKQKFLPL